MEGATVQIQVEECSYINVRFDGGQAVLRQGLAANELEIVFFHVCPAKRNQGIGVAALREIQAHFPEKVLKPIDILEAAEGFWHKMETEGLVSLQ
jgi:ribosomal protein S18 acetylase RimI-like enzyme